MQRDERIYKQEKSQYIFRSIVTKTSNFNQNLLFLRINTADLLRSCSQPLIKQPYFYLRKMHLESIIALPYSQTQWCWYTNYTRTRLTVRNSPFRKVTRDKSEFLTDLHLLPLSVWETYTHHELVLLCLSFICYLSFTGALNERTTIWGGKKVHKRNGNLNTKIKNAYTNISIWSWLSASV